MRAQGVRKTGGVGGGFFGREAEFKEAGNG